MGRFRARLQVRGPAFAIGLVAGIGFALMFVVWAVPEFREPVHQRTAENAQQQKDGRATNQDKGDEPYWRDWIRFLFKGEDTVAQWAMAFFAAAATVISYRAIMLVDRTLKANTDAVAQAKRANDIAQDALVAGNRAWMKLHIKIVDTATIPGGVKVVIRAHAENIGNAPARNVRIIAYPHSAREQVNWREAMLTSARQFALPVVFPHDISLTTSIAGEITELHLPFRIVCACAYKIVQSMEEQFTAQGYDVFLQRDGTVEIMNTGGGIFI